MRSMGRVFDSNGLEILDRDECLALLDRAVLGRVGISIGALPCVLPVNFRLIDGTVVFRTAAGSKLDAATRGAVIAFEVDDVDPIEHCGWSVVVTGIAQEMTGPPWSDPITASAVPRWAPLGRSHLVGLPTQVLSGRRITHARQSPGNHDE